MIIQLRGTSGSGKSTLVRQIMALYPLRQKYFIADRKQPLGYLCHGLGGRNLAIVGHYETDCGGCDTISGMDRIYELVRQSANQGNDVIFEGLLISAELHRSIALHKEGLDYVNIYIDIPVEDCLDSVNQRRLNRHARKGTLDKYKPVNPKNTASKHKSVIRNEEALAQAGLRTMRLDRVAAFDEMRRLLRV